MIAELARARSNACGRQAAGIATKFAPPCARPWTLFGVRPRLRAHPTTAQECDMKLPITIALAAFSFSVATATLASASQHDASKTKCGDEKKDEKKDGKKES